MSKMFLEKLEEKDRRAWNELMEAETLPDKLEASFEKSLMGIKGGLEKELLDAVEGRITENVLDIVLNLMRLLFVLDRDFRKNIRGFEATYVFTDQEGGFYVTAKFYNGRMIVGNKKEEAPSFTLRFRDNEALIKLLFSGSADILNAVLNQMVDFQGNVNYICKFGYMALHILLQITGGQGFAEE